MKDCYKVAIIAPNCFYYQVDLFRRLAQDPKIDLTVYFCSEEGLVSGDVSKMFGTKRSWGVTTDPLQGYNHKFLRNYAPKGSYLNSVTGLMNWGIWRELRRSKPDGIILMSWMNPTWWVAVLTAIIMRKPFFLMTDANVYSERSMGWFKKFLRKLVLGQLLFPYCSGFLCAGVRNRELYKLYGVPEHKLFPFAYSSGYSEFLDKATELKPAKAVIREKLGIPGNKLVILFCGRLIKEKNAFTLLEAFDNLKNSDKALVFVGEGELSEALRDYVRTNNIESVFFMGFQDREQIPRFYAMSDILVLPSERETWGMVVNEAMCFSLPLVVSEAVGASDDMVVNGQNGFIYSTDEGLLSSLQSISDLNEDQRLEMGEKSREIITRWINRDLGLLLCNCLDHVYDNGSGVNA